jgi:hypothetical protein
VFTVTFNPSCWVTVTTEPTTLKTFPETCGRTITTALTTVELLGLEVVGRAAGRKMTSSPVASAVRSSFLPPSLYVVDELVVTVTLAPNSVSTVIVVALKLVIVPPRPKALGPPPPVPKCPKPPGPPRRGGRRAGKVVDGLDAVARLANPATAPWLDAPEAMP